MVDRGSETKTSREEEGDVEMEEGV